MKLKPYTREEENKYVSIRQSGTIGISKDAVNTYLEGVKNVELFYDKGESILGIAGARGDRDNEQTFKLHRSEGTGTINAGAFLRGVGLETEQTERYGVAEEIVETPSGERRMLIARLRGDPWSVYNDEEVKKQESHAIPDVTSEALADSDYFVSVRQSDAIGLSKKLVDTYLEDYKHLRVCYHEATNELILTPVPPERADEDDVYTLSQTGGSGTLTLKQFIEENGLNHESTKHYHVTVKDVQLWPDERCLYFVVPLKQDFTDVNDIQNGPDTVNDAA